MRILVIGSVGRTAREVVALLLARGHQVTTVDGPLATLRATHPELRVAHGDARDVRCIEHALENQDAVVSFFGPRAMDTRDLVVRNLIAATRKLGVPRLVNLMA
jgi:putative NADH-flavin reductase